MKPQALLLIMTLIATTTAFAKSKSPATTEPEINLTCVTEFPTTSYFVKQEGDQVSVRILHHNDLKYVPIHQGLLTTQDAAELPKKAQMIQKLGNELNFKWKRTGCNADSPLFFQCVGEAVDFEQNGLKAHPWALTVTDMTSKTLWGTRKYKNVTMNFSVGDERFEIPMEYENYECVSAMK